MAIVALPNLAAGGFLSANDSYFEVVKFDLIRFIIANMLRGGVTQVAEAAEARWSAEFTTIGLTRQQAQQFKAWNDGLRGGVNQFLAWDPAQQYPVSYSTFTGLTRAGGGAFDGTATVTAVNAPAGQITISTLPASFTVLYGDVVGLIQSGRYGLFRVVGDFAASGAGVLTVVVEPRILTTIWSAGATANFFRPACAMTPLPGSWQYQARGGTLSPVSFSGMQAIF